MQKLDEAVEAKLQEKEYEKEYGHPHHRGVLKGVVLSCLLAGTLMTICFLSVIVVRGCWGAGPWWGLHWQSDQTSPASMGACPGLRSRLRVSPRSAGP
ncbi:MAG: hypothetical protein GTO63_25845 [Anaerolineae bacterium]|nr:hypothetical protein [Anaerolineae bacterium]NIN98169.1 hypothetical protein [Anaerolineae bacterium]NIQ81095.1 hypothetical protein [Anaerolineae bacterium]